ncbi:MAG: hypothetical protein ABIH99_02745 [Candidatus Micrarchaeota archaeon]
MCEICARVKEDTEYLGKINEWFARDISRLAKTREKAVSLTDKSLITIFSNLEFPLEINFPLFEARFGLGVPTNYYQNIFVDGKRLRNDWAHDWCRSLAFLEDGVILFTKAVNARGAPEDETLSHYFLVKFEKDEVSAEVDAVGRVKLVSKDVEKRGVNLLTNAEATHKFTFNFMHNPTEKTIVKRERIESSSLVREIYGRGQEGGKLRLASMDSEEFVVTVPHFAPHPYMLNNYKFYGFESRKDFLNAMSGILGKHLG